MSPRFSTPGFLVSTCLLAVWLSPSLAFAEESEAPAFKIKIDRDGAYRIDFSDLRAIGYDGPGFPTERLGLTTSGRPVALWLHDGDDGSFDPGDWIEFVGRHLRGEATYFDRHTRYNVYWLRTDAEVPLRMRPVSAEGSEAGRQAIPASNGTAPATLDLIRQRHHEEDLLRVRWNKVLGSSDDELWFWKRLAMGREPARHELHLEDLAPKEGLTAHLRFAFRGWSVPARRIATDLPDHVVTIRLNGVDLMTHAWDGTEPELFEAEVPVQQLKRGVNDIEVLVPRRRQDDGKVFVDVVLWNWMDIEYPHSGQLHPGQTFLTADGNSTSSRVLLASQSAPNSDHLLVYGAADGTRRSLRGDNGAAVPTPGQTKHWSFQREAHETAWYLTGPDHLLRPASVSIDSPSQWTATNQQADYLMIAHRKFLEAISPLADFHRQRGLRVKVVAVEDVYDEFNHGIAHPEALKSFLTHAYHRWQSPAPRFVLLVGDASWDGKNIRAVDENYADWTFLRHERNRFGKNESIPYPEDADLNHRHYVPTWEYGTHQGHAASDNYFVAVDGDDSLPDMAIGRLTVADPDEVSAIVEKTIRYMENEEPGSWRKKVLFVTNENQVMQIRSEQVADTAIEMGLEPHRVYPEASDANNTEHTSRLVDAFEEGLFAVHFLGHGGRYIWQTGPPDLKKNHELFGLDHLDQLAPTSRLPIILSLTCYSAPFDHPNADSIGEKFLRIPDRGAIAVVAASWRNRPLASWGQILLTELTQPGATIGEALMRTKHQVTNELFVNTYNLLGDPAVPIPAVGSSLAPQQQGPSDVTRTGSRR
ncbi:MAG: C25 family cysteine peptidase [Thermoanaerobaculia bacterium]|nr:C25 family cysteine peptidase [Thermoanaerobaculia bacterium]